MRISRINKPVVLITMGDPSGIGPEVIVKTLASDKISALANFYVIGDAYIFNRVKRRLGVTAAIPLIDLDNVPRKGYAPGVSRPEFGKAAIDYIDTALELLSQGAADAVVTGPVNKYSIRAAGYRSFTGHTEYLAAYAGVRDFAMMFVGQRLKITLVTRHMPLKEACRRLSKDAIARAILITHKYLREYFGIRHAAIGVCGLNPHAGENGLFGDEERRVIAPAIRRVSGKIRTVTGPIAPDAVFYDALNGRYDAVVSMYHDQALIPFKTLYFRDGVNLTLGLPFIRTSPDHGTAFDIAGRYIADPSSMREAIRLSCRLATAKAARMG